MVKQAFLERLKSGVPMLGDGAMGTLLHNRGGLAVNTCFEALNLEDPDLVYGVHCDYVRAGSDLIETNTFGANRYRLAEPGLSDQVDAINRAAVAIAQRAASECSQHPVYIAGSVGPLGVQLRPYGRLTHDEAQQAFAEQMRALAEAGVDLFQLETFTNHDELLIAVKAARQVAPQLPVIAHATFNRDGVTYTGANPARVASDLYQAGADVIGVNCGSGPADISQILHIMRKAVPEAYFSAMPNAGFPEAVGGRIIYTATADYFGDYVPVFCSEGASVVGGCCGTTPDHIRAMRAALDNPPVQAAPVQVVEADSDEDQHKPVHPTALAERLKDGRFTITVEVAPPRSFTADSVLRAARRLRAAGANMLNIADTPAARMKMSAWALCHLMQTDVGMETVLHFPTRGRNLLRIQGDLLAAHALGLRNIFVTMGDPTRIGDYPDAMDAYDIVPSKLIDLLKHHMNAGTDMAGHSIGTPTSFTVGCALNMAADDPDHEIKVLRKKLESGSDFALGQPVFDPPRLVQFIEHYEKTEGKPFDLPVLMGVMPLYSLRQAHFLHNEVPGITIPDHIFQRLEAAGEDAHKEGVQIAIELMEQMHRYVQGAYIIPAFGRYNLAAEVVNAVAEMVS